MKISSVKLLKNLMNQLKTNKLPKITHYRPNLYQKKVSIQMIKQPRIMKLSNKKVILMNLSRLKGRMLNQNNIKRISLNRKKRIKNIHTRKKHWNRKKMMRTIMTRNQNQENRNIIKTSNLNLNK